ncbi:sugar/nucleoside kinase (ribokinase family) [Aliiruegeria haliotis]|uniref:Sugar/nucleoside kinase (Ribokinase family) n=1 Tax=Aliiruegeria haliotis TaxID=1280846 RepID=A0A2T0REI8_9RHOB|nr:carbohydrate kinase family protein [Aliiruegeria haliotis]PRY19520.1 sugar/nucleoside kinase (ribokinase family) [Aliiruegeria haliotis]
MARPFDVLAIGELNPDLVLSGIAAEGPVLGTEQTFTDEVLTLGSSTAIACVLMQRLGLRTAFAGLVGDDDHGRFCTAALEREGVDTGGVRISKDHATGITVSISYAHDRMLLTRAGTMAVFGPQDIDTSQLASARHIHVGSYFLQDGLRPALPTLFAEARRNGCTTSLDLGWDTSGRWDLEELSAVLPKTDVIFPNLVELQGVTRTSDINDGLDILHGHGAAEIALKRGGAGSIASSIDGERQSHPGFAISVVDTTGAGDAFNAGYLKARLGGATLSDRLALGNACGAVAATASGGTGGLTSLADAHATMATDLSIDRV